MYPGTPIHGGHGGTSAVILSSAFPLCGPRSAGSGTLVRVSDARDIYVRQIQAHHHLHAYETRLDRSRANEAAKPRESFRPYRKCDLSRVGIGLNMPPF